MWSQEEANAVATITQGLPAGITAPTFGDISGVGDRAAAAGGSATISGQTVSISAIYTLKGATFLTFSDLVLNKPAPTIAALAAQAVTSLTRVP